VLRAAAREAIEGAQHGRPVVAVVGLALRRSSHGEEGAELALGCMIYRRHAVAPGQGQ
jgi:hypothetical protein